MLLFYIWKDICIEGIFIPLDQWQVIQECLVPMHHVTTS